VAGTLEPHLNHHREGGKRARVLLLGRSLEEYDSLRAALPRTDAQKVQLRDTDVR
jgi:hypothetical protein